MVWKINSHDVINRGRTPGGEQFTEFVDSLIRANAYLYSLPSSEIRTNLRVNKPDGGVDTEVRKSISDDKTGWIRERPTIWQYKATESKEISDSVLRKEIKKSYSEECIRKGYAYRLCLCDDLPAQKKREWESALTEESRNINPDVPVANVLSAGDLADWASQFPALILQFFRPGLQNIALHFDAWKVSITQATPKFVPVPLWKKTQDQIVQHVTFNPIPPDVVLSITGEAGVGKTRLVFETLSSVENARYLVIYTQDEENALKVARSLLNDSSLKAILVADECGVNGREQLRRILNGARNRIRVVNIDNSGERTDSSTPEFFVEKIPIEIVEKILESNHPEIPIDRRRAYSNLSGGSVRLAADLCRFDKSIASGQFGPVMGNIRDYLRARLNEEEIQVLEALSLVTKVGMKGEVEGEIKDLCALCNLDYKKTKDISDKLHNGPGFVEKAGRYFYITPEVVAQTVFEMAWQRFAKDDSGDFLKRIPPSLVEVFLKRVSRSASKEVRRIVGDFFRTWTNSLNPVDLTSPLHVDILITLIEVEPQTYLSTLRRLVDEATLEELLAITGDSVGRRWGPRRYLVWLLERLAAFQDYFDDVESILLKLALAESEPQIGNNATSIWKNLFQIYVSGTSVPFKDRLQILEQRILSGDPKASSLGLDALDIIFATYGWKLLGPPVVGGRIPPEAWRPRSQKEYRECINNAFTLLQKAITHKLLSSGLIQKAQDIVLTRFRFFIASGYLEKIKRIFSKKTLSTETRNILIQEIEKFLHYDTQPRGRYIPPSKTYIDKMKKWLRSLHPSDFRGRLMSLIGVDQWHHSLLGTEKNWKSDIRDIAIECIREQEDFKQEIKWLFSPDAINAGLLGQELGKLDKEGVYLELIIDSCLHFQNSGLARGYIKGLLSSFPKYMDRVNEKIDNIQKEYPKLAYELFMVCGEMTKALQRAIQLIDAGQLPLSYLSGFTFGIGERKLNPEELEQILSRLLKSLEGGDATIGKIAIDLVAYNLRDETEDKASSVLEFLPVQSITWRIMELTSKDFGQDQYWWGRIIKALIKYDPDKAARIAASGLVEETYLHNEASEEIFISIAQSHPEIVMQRVGEVMLDEKRGWHFYIGTFKSLFRSLPIEIVEKWVEANGVEAARLIARHLPEPYIDSNEEAIVPPLTEFVLKTFETDDRVFHEFCAGVHSFQLYSGDIAAQHEKEAESARKFLNHPLKRIREWADIEIRSAVSDAQQQRQEDEEFWLE